MGRSLNAFGDSGERCLERVLTSSFLRGRNDEARTRLGLGIMTMCTEWHEQTATAFLDRAHTYLAEGDLLQAPRKAGVPRLKR